MKSGIVLRHIVFDRSIEVDKAKVELISKLPPPITVREVRSFSGHAGSTAALSKTFQKILKKVLDKVAVEPNVA